MTISFFQSLDPSIQGFIYVVLVAFPVFVIYGTWRYGAKNFDMEMFASMSFVAGLIAAVALFGAYHQLYLTTPPSNLGIGFGAGALTLFGFGAVSNIIKSNFAFGLWYTLVQFSLCIAAVFVLIYLVFRRQLRRLP